MNEDTVFICECGNDTFTHLGDRFRCGVCKNEYRRTDNSFGWPGMMLRRFNKETGRYNDNWEGCPIRGYGNEGI